MLTTEEALAVAVLKGDTDAAEVLADLICEKATGKVKEVKPKAFKLAQSGKYKAIVYLHDSPIPYQDYQSFHDQLQTITESWLESGSGCVMALSNHVDRVEIFEIID